MDMLMDYVWAAIIIIIIMQFLTRHMSVKVWRNRWNTTKDKC